jgi:hypothetical protein
MGFPNVSISGETSTAAVREHAVACPERPQAAGLVPSKTSGPNDFLEISFDPDVVQQRRVARLRTKIWACGHLHAFAVPKGFRENVWFVTLTYRGVDDWRPGHISRCLRAVRKWCGKRRVPFRYVWVAELQSRGAVHYHLALWLPKRIQLPKFDKQGWWSHGMTQRVIAKNAVGYLMKYLSKITPAHRFPKGVRIHGSGGLTHQARNICSWFHLPGWCKQQYGVGELRTIKGRRVVRATGEILAPMYERILVPAGMRLYANAPLPVRWVDGPYSRLDAQSECMQ